MQFDTDHPGISDRLWPAFEAAPKGARLVTALSMIARNLAVTVFARSRVGVLTLSNRRP